MSDLLSLEEAARACSVSKDTIKRRLRRGEFPGARKGEPHGDRPAPWLVPVEDLAAAGLRPLQARSVQPDGDLDDITSLRLALVHHETLARAREAHMADLRGEIRRLHEQLNGLQAIVASAVPSPVGGAM